MGEVQTGGGMMQHTTAWFSRLCVSHCGSVGGVYGLLAILSVRESNASLG
jgi:hypothetical protein